MTKSCFRWDASPSREWWYTFVGMGGLLCTNAYIGNAGLGTVKIRSWQQRNPQSKYEWAVAFLRIYVRSTVAFISSIVMWVGVYNLIDLYLFGEDSYLHIDPKAHGKLTKDILTLCVGVFFLLITVRLRV